jgi:hypothetical protein
MVYMGAVAYQRHLVGSGLTEYCDLNGSAAGAYKPDGCAKESTDIFT